MSRKTINNFFFLEQRKNIYFLNNYDEINSYQTEHIIWMY